MSQGQKPYEETRKATMEDCQRCDEPPGCDCAGHPCNIQVKPMVQVGDKVMLKKDSSVFEVVAMNEDVCCLWIYGGLMLKNINEVSFQSRPEDDTAKEFAKELRRTHDEAALFGVGEEPVLTKLADRMEPVKVNARCEHAEVCKHKDSFLGSKRIPYREFLPCGIHYCPDLADDNWKHRCPMGFKVSCIQVALDPGDE